MIEQQPSTRVIVLSPDAACASQESAALSEQGVQVVRVTTAYEAAAELIAEPAVALVVDLRLLGPRHLRLLTIAREGQVEILAVGGLPPGMNSEDLSGVRLVSRADLPGALNKIAAPAPAAAEIPAPPDEPLDEGADDFAAEAQLVPAKLADDEEELIEDAQDYQPQEPPITPASSQAAASDAEGSDATQAPAAEPAAAHAAAPANAPAAAPAPHDEQRTLLTPEELAALLENEP